MAPQVMGIQSASIRSIQSSASMASATPSVAAGVRHLSMVDTAGMSTMGAAATLSAGCVGAGLLAMPSVIGRDGAPRAGFIGATCLMIIALLSSWVANNILISALKMAGPDVNSFEMLGWRSLGRTGWLLGSVAANVSCLGFCCAFVILIGRSVAEALFWPTQAGVALTGLLLMGLAFVPLNSALGLVAIGAETVMVPFVLYQAFKEGPAEAGDYMPMGPVGQLGPAFNTIIFALSLAPVIPCVRCDMKSPEDITTASNIAIVVCFCIYVTVMSVCYWAWGDHVKGNVLDSMTGTLALVAKLLLFTNLTLSYGIFMQCVSSALSFSCGITTRAGDAALKIGLGLLVCGIAVLVPFFNEIIDLLSAVSVVTLCFYMPLISFYSLRRKGGGVAEDGIHMDTLLSTGASPVTGASIGDAKKVKLSTCKILVDLLILMVGVLAMVFGLIGGVNNLITAINRGS